MAWKYDDDLCVCGENERSMCFLSLNAMTW